MIRLILLLAIGAVAWYLFRRLVNPPSLPPQAGNPPDTQAGSPPANPSAGASTMLPCAECGVHAPETAGVRWQGLFFCSPEHMNAWLKRNGPTQP